jgi:hypothetical protein
MKKKYITLGKLLGILSISLFLTAAKAQIITFEKHYATTIDKSGKDVLPTDDNGYLIAATTKTSITDDLDIHIIKTNNYGDVLLTKTYGGARVEYPNCMIKMQDGNFFVVGYSQSFGSGDMDIYLLKLNQNGDEIFTKVIGGFGNEEGKEIIQTADGNYVIIGASNSASSDYNIMLVKINPAGDVIWTKYYGGTNYESARSVKLCPDGGFIIAGKTAISPTSVASLYLVKTNSSGDTLWTKKYNGPNSYEGKSIIANNDGTYVLAVDDSSAATDSDVRIMKLDNGGGIIWNKSYGGSLKDIAKVIQPTTDGGYIVGSISRSFGWSNPDMWIIKLDANGDSPWTKNYGGSGHEHLYSLRQTADNGYIAVGHARSFSANWEVYFLKLDQNGVVGVEELAMAEQKFNVFPNPSDGIVNIEMDEQMKFSALKISNSLGQIIFNESADQLKESKSFDLKKEGPGMYFMTLEAPSGIIVKKLIVN